jgi:hypothetical protein
LAAYGEDLMAADSAGRQLDGAATDEHYGPQLD